MKDQNNNKRKVIKESKRKQILNILGSFTFVALSFLFDFNVSNPILFWAIIIFFGGGGILLLVRLLNPKNEFIETVYDEQATTEQFQILYQSLGCFAYQDKSFTVSLEDHKRTYFWTDIECLFGFKKDLLTSDEIYLDVFINDGFSFQISESTKGWFQFLFHLSENVPEVPKNWEIEISNPAFETMLTLLFDRKGRTKSEAEAYCYKE